jgi:hypothetical protein
MPTKRTTGRKKSKSGAGEYVREEMDELKSKKGNVKNRKQAIAIGLSRARRAGEDVPAPKKASPAVRKKAAADDKAGRKKRATKKTATKKRATKKAASKKRATKKSGAKRTTSKRSAAKR